MTDDLDGCLRGRVAAATIDTPADWVTTWFALVAEGHTPIGLAIRGGFAADRVGWAFSAGYQAALRALVANAAPREVLALCVTEAGGNRPRDIATTVQRAGAGRLLVTGRKRWSTLAPLANRLLVVGVDETGAGQEAGRSRLDARPSLVAVSVPAQAAGVSIRAMPETAFVPEVPHAEIDLERVEVETGAVLPGDGYERYVKPFRTVEDIFVSAAVLAYLLREARARAWPEQMLERTATCLTALSALSGQNPDAPATHLALAGTLQIVARLHEQAGRLWDASLVDDLAARRWQRDVPLFRVASEARAQRTRRAWQRLAAAADSQG